jgi:hypothetical protein
MTKCKLIVPLLISILIALTGCSNVNADDKQKETKVSQSKTESEEKNDSKEKETKSYQSITEYRELLTGVNLKYNILKITPNESDVVLDIDLKISPEMVEMMKNTKNKFYFNFSEVEGHNKLTPMIAEEKNYIEGNLEHLTSENMLHLSQRKKLKHALSAEEMKIVTAPENFELVILNEKHQMVAVFIGLELNMIQ